MPVPSGTGRIDPFVRPVRQLYKEIMVCRPKGEILRRRASAAAGAQQPTECREDYGSVITPRSASSSLDIGTSLPYAF